jgi:hypothetical protein
MNRKEPNPLSIATEGRNPSITTHVQDGRNPSVSKGQATGMISRPSPPPAPPLPPVVKKQ